jgi:hypothetical protein
MCSRYVPFVSIALQDTVAFDTPVLAAVTLPDGMLPAGTLTVSGDGGLKPAVDVPTLTISGRSRMRGWVKRLNEVRRAMLVAMHGIALRRRTDAPVTVAAADCDQALGLVSRAFRWIRGLQARLAAEAALFPRPRVERVRIEPAEAVPADPAATLARRRRRRMGKAAPYVPLPEDDIEGMPLHEVLAHICNDLYDAAHLLGDDEALGKIRAIVKAMTPMLRKQVAAVTQAVAVAAVAMMPGEVLRVAAPDTG